MPIISTGGSRSAGFKGRGFHVAGTLTPSFRIQGTQAFLVGEMVGPEEEFLFQAQLFAATPTAPATVIDNFPKATPPTGFYQERVPDIDGYRLVDEKTGQTLFGFKVENSICLVTTVLYDRNGAIIGQNINNDFVLLGGSVRFGQTGRIAEG
jgi:hypothetical protein